MMMKSLTNDFVPASLDVARATLETACDKLDDAVRTLSNIGGDTVMANPGLIALLLNVVVARREVRGLEAVVSAQTAEHLRATARQ